ncbi:hypothetical protein Lalb_Chr14g0372661 [Lupinus albus]|uniref:Uncharacterized protein n=1 Tax=Lupinus albus TaxID=3870 RepID=A0A6A4PFY8_LUPAL|nr:hypothetical protein Lalb_Chr14g0372661 [Lupinus albus]
MKMNASAVTRRNMRRAPELNKKELVRLRRRRPLALPSCIQKGGIVSFSSSIWFWSDVMCYEDNEFLFGTIAPYMCSVEC